MLNVTIQLILCSIQFWLDTHCCAPCGHVSKKGVSAVVIPGRHLAGNQLAQREQSKTFPTVTRGLAGVQLRCNLCPAGWQRQKNGTEMRATITVWWAGSCIYHIMARAKKAALVDQIQHNAERELAEKIALIDAIMKLLLSGFSSECDLAAFWHS